MPDTQTYTLAKRNSSDYMVFLDTIRLYFIKTAISTLFFCNFASKLIQLYYEIFLLHTIGYCMLYAVIMSFEQL